jgi:hypothetical protein
MYEAAGKLVRDVSLNELWGDDEIAGACNGSKRYLVGLLGGWGNCPAISTGGGGSEFVVRLLDPRVPPF